MSGRSIICKLCDGSFFPRLTEPDSTVREPRDLLMMFALSLPGAKPPAMVSWQLSQMIAEPSRP
jgi:hypothetical protein